MTTIIHQQHKAEHDIKVEHITTPSGTEIGISQKISDAVDDFLVGPAYAEIRCTLDALPGLIEALQSELEFLRPAPKVHPGQGQLFNPDFPDQI